jgi:CheY-like chemotaxis protein/anti-sigma regulatory factor (Ser/Thr protein kinase)
LLEREPGLSARTRKYLETTQRALDDVAHTVARMAEFYRQREPALTLAPIQINSLIPQVMDLTRARWSDMPQQRGVVIQTCLDLGSDLPAVAGIESEIREGLVNLIFNAVDAMPEGGTLTLRTRASGEHPLSSPGRLVYVEAMDTGVGMDDETRRRCLEPFFTTKGERGTGLGLAMVFGMAQRHGAEIEIESAAGEGTTVRLAFPIAALVSNETPLPRIYATCSRLRILLIDDDPMMVRSLRDFLEADGHSVVAASGGQEGIDAFRAAESNQPFSLVFTDLGMPRVDGRQVARAVKATRSSTPVIMLTGWGHRLVAEGDVPPHVDRVLNKPPKLRELRTALGDLVTSSEVTGLS